MCLFCWKFRGVFRYRNTYPTAIKLISEGKINIKPLITHHAKPFDKKDLENAFDISRKAKDGAIKVMFNIDWFIPNLIV